MQFVQGLPEGVFVGQTQIEHAKATTSESIDLMGFNLALHVDDDPFRVQQHRMALLDDFATWGVNKITWMTQTHSTICHTINEQIPLEALVGDGLVTQRKAHALMMMTADCLPIVLGNADGTEVANLHAGWRGLAHGIVENTIQAMHTKPTWAWMGAAISQACFEVGAEVKEIFCSQYSALSDTFIPSRNEEKFQADLYAIARYILTQQGVVRISGGDQCSYQQANDFYSYRRNPKTGRMATFVFIQ